MRQSLLFTKTRKEAPKDEVAKNAQLLIRGGFIHKEMAGVYSFLTLGLRVLERINAIIRDEMNKIGGQEILMTTLQSKELWEKTDRWSDEKVDNWFKSTLKNGSEVGLGFTHEEPISNMMRNFVSSYQDLPKLVYQIQWKFRNEERAKSGIMRGREFLMKDMYSFATSREEHEKLYESIAAAYASVFARVGIGDRTYRTFASGGVFSKFSHEFQCLSDVGEDVIYTNQEKDVAINKEVMVPDVLAELGVSESDLTAHKAVEVGNIFSLGTRFSEPLGLTFKNSNGESEPVIMGSYGIGPTRLMGVVAEIHTDERGILWPQEIAPFRVHMLALASGNKEVMKEADKLYDLLIEHGIDVLYDDRDLRAGEKFADADLIGIPTRIIVSEKTIQQGGVEVVSRVGGDTTFVSESNIFEHLSNK